MRTSREDAIDVDQPALFVQENHVFASDTRARHLLCCNSTAAVVYRATHHKARLVARWSGVEDGRIWVETVVVDDPTGELLPCGVHFRSPGGVRYQLHGHRASASARSVFAGDL